jgi:SagB-type dehydrogenase family enzyme
MCWLVVLAALFLGALNSELQGGTRMIAEHDNPAGREVELPNPAVEEGISLAKALSLRQSTRSYADDPLALDEAAQLLWAAQGINRPKQKFRTAPSAGATFPLEVLLVAGEVSGLEPGVYRYRPTSHTLSLVKPGDQRDELFTQALRQSPINQMPAVVVIAAVYERTTRRYGDRGERYVHMEVGHAGQNIHLQAASLGLGTVVIGAFNDSGVRQALGLREEEHPLYLMPVGRYTK